MCSVSEYWESIGVVHQEANCPVCLNIDQL